MTARRVGALEMVAEDENEAWRGLELRVDKASMNGGTLSSLGWGREKMIGDVMD